MSLWQVGLHRRIGGVTFATARMSRDTRENIVTTRNFFRVACDPFGNRRLQSRWRFANKRFSSDDSISSSPSSSLSARLSLPRFALFTSYWLYLIRTKSDRRHYRKNNKHMNHQGDALYKSNNKNYRFDFFLWARTNCAVPTRVYWRLSPTPDFWISPKLHLWNYEI